MSSDTKVRTVRTADDLPPVGVVDERGITPKERIIFGIIAIVAALGWMMLAIVRGETVNSMWFVFAAVGSYIIAFRFYSKFVERKLARSDDARATPAEEFDNGKDFMPTDRRVLFGHHFAAISGAGPLVGPVLASQMGYLPGTLWIVIGVILAGAVQDFLVLHLSTRRHGRSLGQMARDELGPIGGWAAILGVLTIMIILMAVLGIVIIGALGHSPWGVFSLIMTVPIAIFMGLYLRYWRPGRVTEVSAIGVSLLLFAIIAGGWVAGSDWGKAYFTWAPTTLALVLCGYGFIAAVLPVWLLLAPRDYLSTFMKIGTIIMLAVGVILVHPNVAMPAITEFASSGKGPAFAGSLFPFLFITIACGALSGFHSLVASGTTPKLLEKESQARMIGYGGMLAESFVAMMALVAACVIDQHVYFAMNAPLGATGGTPEKAAAYVNSLPLFDQAGRALPPVSPEVLAQTAKDVGEESIISRTGGAPTLALGIANIMGKLGGGLTAFWYHFAVMFEALFILTTIDAGTRVARFMFSDSIGNIPGLHRFKDTSWVPGAWISTGLVVLGWGSILYIGVTDPLGGVNMFFPLFGIANQLLAAIALCVVFAVVMKKGLFKWAWIVALPLGWDLLVTMWASWEKIFSPDVKIGAWALHDAAKAAKDAGKLPFLTAKTPEQLDAVIRNSAVQGTLATIYALLVLVVFAVTVQIAIKAYRLGGMPTSEAEPVPSRIFAPSSFLPTDAEKAVLQEWADAGKSPVPLGRTHG